MCSVITRVFINNYTNIESILSKKHIALEHHYVLWNVTTGVVNIDWINNKDSLDDTFTK